MRARLERLTTWGDEPGDLVQPAPLDPASSGVIVRLVLERPNSAVGRKVELHIRGDEILAMLAWMRYEATRQRAGTEAEARYECCGGLKLPGDDRFGHVCSARP